MEKFDASAGVVANCVGPIRYSSTSKFYTPIPPPIVSLRDSDQSYPIENTVPSSRGTSLSTSVRPPGHLATGASNQTQHSEITADNRIPREKRKFPAGSRDFVVQGTTNGHPTPSNSRGEPARAVGAPTPSSGSNKSAATIQPAVVYPPLAGPTSIGPPKPDYLTLYPSACSFQTN